MEDPGRSDFEKSVHTDRELHDLLGSKPPAGPRASENVRAIPVVLLKPERCHPSDPRTRVYTTSSEYAPVPDRWAIDSHFRESIRYWQGNLRSVYAQQMREADPGDYVILAGTRRWAACLLERLPLAAQVLPIDMPEDEIARLVAEDNTATRRRDPVVRMEEALAAEPAIRKELRERKRRHHQPLPEDVDPTTIYEEMAKRYFADFDHGSKDYVRKLYVLVITAVGRGAWYEAIPQVRDAWPGDGPSPKQIRLRDRARDLVDQLRLPSETQAKAPTVSGAYRELETLYYDLKGEPAPDGRSAERKARAQRDRADYAEDWLWNAQAWALDVKPWALMTHRDIADMVAGLSYRDWSILARRWPFAIRRFLDVTYLLTEAHVHSRSKRTAIDLARAALHEEELAQLAAALHQIAGLLYPSGQPDWWRGVDVVWPPIDPSHQELRDLGLNLEPPPASTDSDSRGG